MNDHFLARWSKRKHGANRGEKLAEAPASSVVPEPAGVPTSPALAGAEAPAPLPDVASLTPESDFSPFMREDVPEPLKRQALKTLFEDPRFNVMDGLDVYIDDFSKPDPLPEGWLEQLNQVARLGDYREPEPEVPEKHPESAGGDGSLQLPAQPVEAPPADTAEPPSPPPEVTES